MILSLQALTTQPDTTTHLHTRAVSNKLAASAGIVRQQLTDIIDIMNLGNSGGSELYEFIGHQTM